MASEYARRVFTLDVRSLALMRIAVAASVLVDLFTRLVHCTDHYSDEGVLPRATASAVSWLADTSLLAVSGSPAWVVVVFVIAIGLAVAVLVGWRTRVSTLLLWLVVLSIQHRNPLVGDHRDILFSISLCCGLLMPWGAAFSIDARRRVVEHGYFGIPSVAYVIQLACIYLFAFLLKTGPEWRSDFTAVEHAVSLEYWARPAASFLLDHPTLTSVLTAAVLGFEAAIAPLLFWPWRNARWIVVGGLCALQLGFAIFLWLDTFPMIAAAMTLGLVPWPRDERAPAEERSRPITVLALAFLVYVLALDVMSLGVDPGFAKRPAELLGIEQNWNMFAPSPTRWDGWFVVQAKRADGQAIDLLTGRGVEWSRPQDLREGIRTTRELVYMRRLLVDDERRASFAAARCRDHASIAVYFVPIFEGDVKAPELLVARDCP